MPAPSPADHYAHRAAAALADGALERARAEASSAVAENPSHLQARLLRAAAHKGLHAHEAAATDLEHAAALCPGRPAILLALGAAYAELDRLHDALRVLYQATQAAPGNAEAQLNLGSVLVRLGRLDEAEGPCRAALAVSPDLVAAHQNLSAILAARDPAGARSHRDAAYARQQVFIDRAPQPGRTILVLSAADAANVPLRHLLPPATTTLIRWYVEYARPDQDRALPPFDLIFNAIGEPDLAPALPAPAQRLLEANEKRLLNPPPRIARTSRSKLPALLAGLHGVLVPPVTRLDEAWPATHPWPALFRPIGSHGGDGVQKLEAPPSGPPAKGTLAPFVDYASPDGWYRKYRMIFVDRRPYPYHLAIARHWLVHYWTAGMEQDAARRAEECRFLADPEATLGTPALAAVTRIGARLDLDYAGIDFALVADGRVLVFEANATMLVHPERDAAFAYRNQAVDAIRAAFNTMLDRRAA